MKSASKIKAAPVLLLFVLQLASPPSIAGWFTRSAPVTQLFSKKLDGGGCAAAFTDGTDLLLVTADQNRAGVTRYDPRNGLFFSTGATPDEVGPTCDKLPPTNILRRSKAKVAVTLLSNSMARKVFDDALTDSSGLRELITGQDPYFRYNGTYEHEKMFTPLQLKLDLSQYGVSETGLRGYTSDQVASIAGESRQRGTARAAEVRQSVKEFDSNYGSAHSVWESRAQDTYSPGDSVCTSTNEFGNIEEVTAMRFKVHVIGRVASVQASFYSGIPNARTQYEKVEEPRWYERNQVAHCSFGP